VDDTTEVDPQWKLAQRPATKAAQTVRRRAADLGVE
jgi:hypothetical protein